MVKEKLGQMKRKICTFALVEKKTLRMIGSRQRVEKILTTF